MVLGKRKPAEAGSGMGSGEGFIDSVELVCGVGVGVPGGCAQGLVPHARHDDLLLDTGSGESVAEAVPQPVERHVRRQPSQGDGTLKRRTRVIGAPAMPSEYQRMGEPARKPCEGCLRRAEASRL